jgi:methyl-accepting chemotaxis protein
MAMKISQQLKCTAIGILAIGSSSLISVYLNSLGNDSKVVNLTGIVRGGTQRLVKLELAGKQADLLIEKQNRLVNGLINGDLSLELPAATDPDFRARMQTVASAWVDLKQQILAARNDPKYKPELLDASEKYFDLADRAVSSAEKYSNAKIERLRTIQIVIFGSSLILLIIIWLTVNKIIHILNKSTDNITISADRIAAVVSSQTKSIDMQAIAVNKTTQVVQGLQEFTQQSTITAQTSIDLVDRTLELVKQVDRSVRKNSLEISIFQSKLTTLVDRIDRLKDQNNKIVEMVVKEQETTNSRQTAVAHIADPRVAKIQQLSANLQLTIVDIFSLSDESLKSISLEVESTKQTTTNLRKTIENMNFLSLNDRQIWVAAKQNASAVKNITISIEQLNAGARETATSITEVGLSATELSETTQSLKMKI